MKEGNEKMKYEKPIVELIELELDDIVCASPEDEEPGLGGGGGGDNNGGWN